MKIYGASGHGGVILDSVLSSNGSVECFIDDALKSEFLGLDVHLPDFLRGKDEIIIAIGNNAIRRKVVNKLKDVVFVNAVHADSMVSPHTRLGDGIAVMAGVVVNQGSSIGNHVILNTNCSIDHDCIIEDFVHVSPGATLCGGIKVGEATQIGAGATILPNLKIGKNVVIGAGALVTKDVLSETTVAGVPARLV
jgi:acetyltransferase EpsM